MIIIRDQWRSFQGDKGSAKAYLVLEPEHLGSQHESFHLSKFSMEAIFRKQMTGDKVTFVHAYACFACFWDVEVWSAICFCHLESDLVLGSTWINRLMLSRFSKCYGISYTKGMRLRVPRTIVYLLRGSLIGISGGCPRCLIIFRGGQYGFWFASSQVKIRKRKRRSRPAHWGCSNWAKWKFAGLEQQSLNIDSVSTTKIRGWQPYFYSWAFAVQQYV